MALTNILTGANGSLGIAISGTSAEQGETSAIIDAHEVFTVGRVTGIQVRVDTDLEEFHGIGQRHAVSLNPANIHVSGTIDRAYINGALIYLLMGKGALSAQATEPYPQPTFNLTLLLRDPNRSGNNLQVTVNGVKFQNWGLQVPEDDFVMEQVKFKALSISITDTEEEQEIAIQFPEAS